MSDTDASLTKSTRVLVVSELGANLGHLLRLQPVIKALQQRGHEVILAVPDPTAAQGLLKNDQLHYVLCPQPYCPANITQQRREVLCYADILDIYAFGDEARLCAALQAWAGLLENIRPDVLLIEFAPLALLIARLHLLPAVHLAIGWEAPPSGDTLPVIRAKAGAEGKVLALEATLVHRINAYCDVAGVPRLDRLSDLYQSAVQLIATLPETDHFGPRAAARYIGPLFSPNFGSVVQWPAWTSENRPKRVFLYVQPDKTNLAILTALKDLDVQVIAVLPGIQAQAAARLNDDHFQIYAHPVQLAGLLERANLVICNAGHGLNAASLLAGVGMLLIPRNAEHVISARRIQSTGAGRILALDHINDHVHKAIEELLDDSRIREQAQAISRKYAHCTQNNVIAQVVDALERAVSQTASKRIICNDVHQYLIAKNDQSV